MGEAPKPGKVRVVGQGYSWEKDEYGQTPDHLGPYRDQYIERRKQVRAENKAIREGAKNEVAEEYAKAMPPPVDPMDVLAKAQAEARSGLGMFSRRSSLAGLTASRPGLLSAPRELKPAVGFLARRGLKRG